MIEMFLNTWFLLVLGHYLCDFAFQSDVMAKGKNRNNKVDPSKIPAGQKYDRFVWIHWLTAHSAIHAIPVYIITGMPILSIAELICHWIIDYTKCNNVYGIRTDQLLHILCKAIWAYCFVNAIL